MPNTHEPREAFVEKLEWQIAADVRHRNRTAAAPRWPFQSPLKMALAAATLVIVSMIAGGAVVAAAYQNRDSQQREMLAAGFVKRVELARQRLELARDQVTAMERKVSVGMASNQELLDSRGKLAEAEAQLRSAELQAEEVRLSGRDPVIELSAPLVSGRDFVSERLRIEMTTPAAALDVERARLRDVEMRVSLGVVESVAVDESRARLLELQAGLESYQLKLDLRQRFLKGEVDAVQTGLRALRIDAEQRLKALRPKIDLARRVVSNTEQRVNMGAAQRTDLAEATLRLQELQLEAARVELDLAVIIKQIGR